MRISDWSSDVCSSDLDRASGRNLAAGFTLNTVGEAVGYFQSRRRHFVSLLYLMADACKGTKKLEPEHAFDVLLPVVEYCCISFTGWNWKGVLEAIFHDFTRSEEHTSALQSLMRISYAD